MKIHLPKFPLRLLRWFCREDFIDEIEGDLIEVFEKEYLVSPKTARRRLAWSVIKHFRWEFIKSYKSHHATPTNMVRHNLLITYRNFRKYKASFFINLIGLSTGLACALIIYLWVNDELNMDAYNEKDAQLYQVMESVSDASGINTGEGTPGILAKALAEEFPEVEYATAVVPAHWFSSPGILSVGDKKVKALGQYADQNYFNVFSLTFTQGDKKNALSDKYGMVISEDMALKLFNTKENVIGKTVEWRDNTNAPLFHITGLFKDQSQNATNRFDIMLNYDIFLDTHDWLKEWGNSDPNTFVIIRNGVDVAQLNKKLAGFIKSKYKESNQALFLQRYSERYLHGTYKNGVPAGGRIEYVRLFSIIAIFLLLIACINFMNLSTARASRRLKEVGIKKAIGASRGALSVQYFEESVFMAFLSLVVAIGLVVLVLPQFNTITGKTLALEFDMNLFLAIGGITLFTGLVSGIYPALYLSAFRTVEVIKGKMTNSMSELLARKGLVIFQFVISVILIVSVLVVYKQVEYIQLTNLGYDRDHILHFEMEIKGAADENFFAEGGAFEKKMESLLNDVKKIPGVIDATNADHNLTGRHGGLGGIDWRDGKDDDAMLFSNLEVGYDFTETMGIKMAQGRSFSKAFAMERSKVIFNQAAIDRMGIPDPIGKTIRLWGKEKQIIGVARNFNFESLYNQVGPCVIQLEPRCPTVIVKINGADQKETIARLQHLYNLHCPGLTFDYQFIDDDYQALYLAELRVSSLSKYFALIAILVSCLGLFGLAAFTAERRFKEIGIRKILGSGEWSIVYLLSGEFTRMVVIAIVIALPASYFITNWWLHAFAYRIQLAWWFFAGAGLLALMIAWLTVGLQTFRAAKINPVNILKIE